MKTGISILILLLLLSCTEQTGNLANNKHKMTEQKKVISEFQSIIDDADVKGSILVYDLGKNTYYSNDFEWSSKGYLPASTFKIINSVIALETAVVEDDATIFKWDGKPKRFSTWEQNLSFREAFHFSCVPCYQDIARKIGTKRMNEYITKFNYGNMKVQSNNIDMFWLQGESHISQFQQIAFLKNFYQFSLPISERTHAIMTKMMIIEANEEYTLSGKTGWSVDGDINNGWFVGYLVDSAGNVYFFASNVEPEANLNMDEFPQIRKMVVSKALQALQITK